MSGKSARVTVLVLMAQGFEEMELVITADILHRAGFNVQLTTLAQNLDPVLGSRGISIVPDCTLDDASKNPCDLVVLPGGMEGTERLMDDARVLELLRNQHQSGKLLAAICAAPMVLAKAGLLKGRVVTSHPGVREQLVVDKYSEERVVIDGNLITSRAPGTTFEFAYTLIAALDSREKAEAVNAGVLARV